MPLPVIPLVVDLDGSLARTDTLHEALVILALRRPWHLFGAAAALRGGRAVFKRHVGRVAVIDCALLPFDEHVLALIARRRAAGSAVHLVTAADQSIADGVAAALGVFDTATGSDGSHNLKSGAKAAYLAERFPEGFDYVGDCNADLAVWRRTGRATLAGGSQRLARRLQGDGLETTVLACRRAHPRDWIELLRPRRWAANLLLFAPSVVAPSREPILPIAMAWMFFGMAGSAANLIGILGALASERRHPIRRDGPLASGRIAIGTALAVSAALLAGAATGAALLSAEIAAALLTYVALLLACHSRPDRKPLTAFIGAGGTALILLLAGQLLTKG